MISAYRTFAATAAFMGVTEHQVEVWVDGPELRGDGPLVARLQADGRRLIHHDDLIAFRRPLSLSTSEIEDYSALCKLGAIGSLGDSPVASSPQLATTPQHPEAVATDGATARPTHLRLVRP